MFERLAFLPPIDVIRQRDRSVGAVAGFVEVDETVRLRIGERPQKDVIDHAKDGGVRADAEREGEHGDDGEAGRFTELTEGEAEVVHGNFRVSSFEFRQSSLRSPNFSKDAPEISAE